MKNIYLQIPLTEPDISGIALATVTMTEGSTPQKPGSSALFSKSGLISGTIGGGVLEGKVEKIAVGSIKTRKAVHEIFMLNTNISDGEDALCGGKIRVLIDPELSRHLHVFEALKRLADNRIPAALITLVTNEKTGNVVIDRYWSTENERSNIPEFLMPLIEPELGTLVSGIDSYDFRELEIPQADDKISQFLFLEPVIPLPRMIIAGAGHIGKAVSHLGRMLDFDVTVIDDRPEFASKGNLPDADLIICESIAEAMRSIEKSSSYIVIVTRGHRDDGGALRECIRSDAAYIGMIGSKTKVEVMRREFLRNGWATEEQWGRVHSPIGLEIGSKTVEEIAVSIAAQLVIARNKKHVNA